jgi:hypothetical protein
MATYTTKYSIDQTVWMVRHETFYRIVKCEVCKNTGRVQIGVEEFVCPKCDGKAAHRNWAGEKYYVYGFSTVGQVRVEDCPGRGNWTNSEPEPNPKFEYMLYSTGVGSGGVWKEADLFETEAEARQYCDQKNGVLLADECEMQKTL